MEQKLEIEHSSLREKIEAFLNDDLSAADLKHFTAPFGIYQQRNDLFMTRIRITGGHLTTQNLHNTAAVIEDNNIAYAHLSTRQDIQLHWVPPQNIYSTVRQCTKNGLPFKGGGGNTFRNIAVSPDSGITPECVFDVIPYAKSLNDIIFSWDKAFELPRKIKIGFVDSEKDAFMAAFQDLGFVAVTKNGKPGFKVYGGGGLGRGSALGVELIDFLPCNEVPRCALAMTELFYDHGDRQNRNAARIRFIVKRLGQDKFIELFHEYFNKTDLATMDFPKWKLDLEAEIKGLSKFDEQNVEDTSYHEWLKYAVTETAFGQDIVSVKIFVPSGNLRADQIKKIAVAVDNYGGSFVRLTANQNILLPLVHKSALPVLYKFLKNEMQDIDLTLKSFKGHVTSCVGSTVCKIGILDSQSMGNYIGFALDEYFKNKTSLKAEKASRILDMIKVSGCPNSCSGHPAACIGLQGQKKKINGKVEPVYKIFSKRDCKEFALAESEDYFVLEEDAPERVLELMEQSF
jgi:sulfite reductase beta subunit-like hemoprotein